MYQPKAAGLYCFRWIGNPFGLVTYMTRLRYYVAGIAVCHANRSASGSIDEPRGS
jgi:hypothetical protein